MELDDVRLMRLEEVLEVCKLSKSTLYQLMSQGLFPRPVLVGARAVRWRESEVIAWLAARPLASEVKGRM